MKKFVICYLSAFAVFAFLGGCNNKHYLDKPTAPGTVPPVHLNTASPVSEPTGATLFPGDSFREENREASYTDSQETLQSATELNETFQKDSIRRFSEIYTLKNKPRMAIFINRSLSDKIKEWSSDGRFIVEGDGTIVLTDTVEQEAGRASVNSIYGQGEIIPLRTSSSNNQDISIDNGSIVITSQRKERLSGDRRAVEEKILWKIENEFLEPFLGAHAIIVDRATILRLMVSEHDTNALTDIPEKNIEMSALKKYADIYIELLISHSRNNDFLLKAIAKEVRTGRILAVSDLSDESKKELKTEQEVTVSSRGFEIVNKQQPLKIKEFVQEVSIGLMNSFSTAWEVEI